MPPSPIARSGDAPAASPADAPAQTVLTRSEVLDSKLAVCGYEFGLKAELRDKVRSHSRSVRDFMDGMLIDQLASVGDTILADRGAWLQQWEGGLSRSLLDRLPKNSALMVVPERPDQAASAAVQARLAALRNAGIEVWLDNCMGTPWFDSLLGVANGAVLRLGWHTPQEVSDLMQQMRREHPKLVVAAWEVGTVEDFNLLKKLGCQRFSGGFVTRRGEWAGNQLAPQVVNVAALINKVREDAEVRDMARILKQDVAMSYRLLRYVNSAAHALATPISGIEQALVVLGQAQLDRWLTLLMLSGSAQGGNALMEASLTRARFLELVGEGRQSVAQCDHLFVLGLFSMLDVALQVPLQVALKPLDLPGVMNMALVDRSGPYGNYLNLAEACERGNVDEVCKYATAIGINTARVNALHLAALEWVALQSRESTAVSKH